MRQSAYMERFHPIPETQIPDGQQPSLGFLRRMVRALNPLVLENKTIDQKIAQNVAGALLLFIAAPVFIEHSSIMPDPHNEAMLLRHGITMGLSAGGTLGGAMYILRGLGQIQD